MIVKSRAILLAVGNGGELPTEFRLFVPGWNETENGKFLFDSQAAKAVMAAYKEWGVDLMIDLEHQALEVNPGASDPTARDARGWCKLELRGGELWAVDVRWTPDGAERLQQKRQRYVSPAFECDPKTKRVSKMINVAITSIPATHDTPALVAASKKVRRMNLAKLKAMIVKLSSEGLDPSLVQKALDAVEKGDAKAALDILKSLIASAAGAEPPADGDEDGSQGDGAEGVSEPPTEESVEDPKVVDNAAPAAGGDDGGDGGEDDEDDQKPEKKAARRALHGLLCRLTGKKTFAECVAEVETFRASHLALETERKQLAKERATLESAERRKLVVELVTLGAEFPSTVWADDKQTAIKPRWQKMPIAELRSHVSEQRAARKQPARGAGVQPPPGSTNGIELTDDEQKHVAKLSPEQKSLVSKLDAHDWKIVRTTPGATPEGFAAMKLRRDGNVNGK